MNKTKILFGLFFLALSITIDSHGFPSDEVTQTEDESRPMKPDCFLKIKVEKCAKRRQLQVLIGNDFTDSSVFIGGRDQQKLKCLPVPCSISGERGGDSRNLLLVGNEISTNPDQLKNAKIYADEESCIIDDTNNYVEVQCGGANNREEVKTKIIEEKSIVPAVGIQWQNHWDGHLQVNCPNRQGMVRVRSVHDNGREDRLWQWDCAIRTTTDYSKADWTGTVNWWDDPLFFMCPVNEFICGAESWHDNGREDRLWRFKCCKSDNHYTRNCVLSGWANGLDAPMDFNINQGSKVITGAFSFHRNQEEDRQWRFSFCDYKFCSPL